MERQAYELYDQATKKSFGRPRGSQAAATKRAEKLNSVPGGPRYGVRPILISAAVTDGQVSGVVEASNATDAAWRASQIDTDPVPPATCLVVSDLHKEAKEAWQAVLEEDPTNLIARYLIDAHEADEDAWLKEVG